MHDLFERHYGDNVRTIVDDVKTGKLFSTDGVMYIVYNSPRQPLKSVGNLNGHFMVVDVVYIEKDEFVANGKQHNGYERATWAHVINYNSKTPVVGWILIQGFTQDHGWVNTYLEDLKEIKPQQEIQLL